MTDDATADGRLIVQSLAKLKHLHAQSDYTSIETVLSSIGTCSSLAENVKLRVVITSLICEPTNVRLLNENGTLNSPAFVPPTSTDAQAFFEASQALHNSAVCIYNELRNTNYLLYVEQSFANLKALNAFNALKSPLTSFPGKKEEGAVLLGVGMGLVLVEQLLWCLCPPEFVPPTRLFKDLLSCSELQQILGPSLLGIIQVLCGLPIGVNLRNVVWHGFCNASEIHPAYSTLLMVLIHTLYEDFFVPRKIDFQERIATQFADFSMVKPSDNTILEMSTRDDELQKALYHSYFVIPGREELIWSGISEWKKGNSYQALVLLLPQLEHSLRRMFISANHLPSQLLCADYSRYYTTLDIFLADSVVLNAGDGGIIAEEKTGGPNIRGEGEAQIIGTNHSRKYIRPKYKLQPDTPPAPTTSSMSSASTSSSSTSLTSSTSSTDTPSTSSKPSVPSTSSTPSPSTTSSIPITSSTSSDPPTPTEVTQPNLLTQEIGPNLMNALRDIFLYASGPRIRDRIAHGEIPLDEKISFMANDVVSLFLALIAQCALAPLTSPTLRACASLYQSYTARWSPGALLENDFACAWKSMEEWYTWWDALPARLSAPGQDLEDYVLAHNTQDATDLTADLEARFNRLMAASLCELAQSSGMTYPNPTQLNRAAACATTTPGPAPTTRQIAQKAASACQTLRAKLDGLVCSAVKGQLARRGGAALYKGLKSAPCVVAGLHTALAIAHCAFLSQLSSSQVSVPTSLTSTPSATFPSTSSPSSADVPSSSTVHSPSPSVSSPSPSVSSPIYPIIRPIMLTRLNSLLERANVRMASMEWSMVLETWTEMCKVSDKFIKIP